MGTPKYVLSIDEGTTSTRSILFDQDGVPNFTSQQEFTQIYPNPGWTEHDPEEIYAKVEVTLHDVMQKAGASASDIAAIGITNQRETTVAWDVQTGKPLHNALVWLDLRTADIAARLEANGGKDRFRAKTGLPVSTYFSAVKMMWLLENVPAVADAVAEGRCLFGTIDSWILYRLTGGPNAGGAHNHLTDVTNASRTMLMDLKTLDWDRSICEELGIPIHSLPQIRSNSEVLGTVKAGPLAGVPITSTIGDQHAALLGQGGLARTTPMLRHGLLTTMGWKLGPQAPTVYALEGAVAVAGRGVQWLRDQLKAVQFLPLPVLWCHLPCLEIWLGFWMSRLQTRLDVWWCTVGHTVQEQHAKC
jgi:glycerol kinase